MINNSFSLSMINRTQNGTFLLIPLEFGKADEFWETVSIMGGPGMF